MVCAAGPRVGGGAMTARNQVLDTSLDPLDERRRRRRQWQRVAVPIGCVVLMAAAILAIAFYSDSANRRGVLVLSDDMLDALESRIALAVSDYLDPAARAVRAARDIARNRTPEDRRQLSETYGAVTLKEVSQVANVSVGDADGNYLLVRRGPAGGTDIKEIINQSGTRQVTWIHRNDEGQETGRRSDPADTFDPRQRPWYIGAVATTDLFWTPPYVFYTDRQPGITVALSDRDADGRQYVYGVDLTLDELSRFLASLTIGRSGRAVIVSDAGQLIAAPGDRSMRAATGQESSATRIEELGDPIMTRAFDQYRIEGHGHRTIEISGHRYITSAAALESTGRNWSILVVVPESDFTGFVEVNNRRALILSLGIVAIALLLAGLLIRQGLRADRAARLLLDRQRAIERQSAAFASLAADVGLVDPAGGTAPLALTETLAAATEARRAGLWRFAADGRTLRCEDLFDRATAGHVDGLELHRDELPQLFECLMQAKEIDTPDAAGDRYAAEAYRILLRPLGSRALLVVPVLGRAQVLGAVWLEDSASTAGIRDFVRAVASMVALRMSDMPVRAEAAALSPEVAAPRTADAPGGRIAELRAPLLDPERVAADFYGNATVMVLQVADPMDLAQRLPDGGRAVSDELARVLQDVATHGGIPYLKIAGQQAIAAAGLTAAGTAAAPAVADSALAARDRCAALFEEGACAHEFRIGIDCGTAIGNMVGDEPRIFNLWGDAVRAAESMAASAVPGTIQVTEAAYLQLRHNFLLRPRGRFHLPRVGEARTFVLAGRL